MDEGNSYAQHLAEATILFGSAITTPSRRPASVRATCEAIGLPRSTFYYQSRRSPIAAELEQKIVLRLHELKEAHPNDGYRRMTRLLQLEGFQVNRKRIARLMQIHGLNARTANSAHTTPRSSPSRASLANLLQTTRITGPNQVWLAEIAYVRIRSGLVYTAVVIDAWLHEVMGYAISLQISNRLASIALHSAVRAQRPSIGCILHSACGSQYFMRGYARLIREYGLVPSAAQMATGQSLLHGAEPCTPRQLIEMPSYESWIDVAQQSRAFVQEIYSDERVDRLLGRRGSDDSRPAHAKPGTHPFTLFPSGAAGSRAPHPAFASRAASEHI